MSWEQRGKKKYYYRKKRIGKRVYSIYLGDESRGKTMAELDETRKALTEKARKRLYAIAKEEKEVDEIVEHAELLVNAIALISGYHRHKGQWRKTHERNN